MRRRDFLRLGSVGAATIGFGAGGCSLIAPGRAQAATATLSLSIEETYVELIDGEIVLMMFYHAGDFEDQTVGPVLRAQEGDRITIEITNNARGPHGFAIPGAPGSEIPHIAPGATAATSFTAPAGGAYLYLDPVDAPVNRVLGLHGAFVVAPRDGRTALGSDTPYSAASRTPELDRLFDALGSNAPRPVIRRADPGDVGEVVRFPGNPWDPSDPEREKVWIFNQIDPRVNAALERGESLGVAGFVQRFLPRYFTLNGVSGFDSSFDERNVAKGYIGQPTILRSMNAGLATHAPHIHGNHVARLAEADPSHGIRVSDNIVELDTWRLPPLHRVDLLLPFEQPSDIPPAAWPPFEEPFPLFYPMHCHTEMSQTAAGGNYPQGLVTDWEILGPLEKLPGFRPPSAAVSARPSGRTRVAAVEDQKRKGRGRDKARARR